MQRQHASPNHFIVLGEAHLLHINMVKRPGPASQGWHIFLRNHAPDIAAMDLFVVPTIGFEPRANSDIRPLFDHLIAFN